MPEYDTIIILDYGSQYSQLIARRVREAHVFSVILPWQTTARVAREYQPAGFILSGGPNSVYDKGAPTLPDYVVDSGKPVLGICYGMQLLNQRFGGIVAQSVDREYGPASLQLDNRDDPLFADWQSGIGGEAEALTRVWMSHGDKIEVLAPGFEVLAHSDNSPFAAMADPARNYYAVQFHPEVGHTVQGRQILNNFVLQICGCRPTWTTTNFIEEQTSKLRDQIGEGRVILGLSGGVDSAVVAALIDKAVGNNLSCVFVDHGLLRQGEADQVIQTFKGAMGMNLIAVNAIEEFLGNLVGVIDPEQKRRIIGELFVRIFEREAAKLGKIDFLAQGTIYPDVIESASHDQLEARTIKTHHNVGGLPKNLALKLVEPLRQLFKDEVRELGEALGLPSEIVWRQPFPGPGLAIRCLGEVTWERVQRLRAADSIFLQELASSRMLKEETQQAFAVLLPVRSVGVMGDGRTYDEVVALRAVTTDDFMTADWARIPEKILARTSQRIVNEVDGVNRVVYDITSKPPGTIEWE